MRLIWERIKGCRGEEDRVIEYGPRDPDVLPMRYLRQVHGPCDGCHAGEKQWCDDDCTYMDPMDWR